MEGIVYLLASWESNLFKIGITRSLTEKRRRQLKTGNGEKIEILREFKTEHFLRVEKLMHLKHANKRAEGEWFTLTDEDILNFERDCKTAHDTIQTLVDAGNPFI
jgi:hypothetical protein